MIDASHLGLVDVGSWRLHTSDLTKVNSPYQRVTVVPGLSQMSPTQLDRLHIEALYRPGGPMGPMRENPYRDWPPAREGRRR